MTPEVLSQPPRPATNKRVFAQRAAQSDGDSMETQGRRGSIGHSCRGTARQSCHRRSSHRPRPCRYLRVPCALDENERCTSNPTPDRDPWDHPDWTPLLCLPTENGALQGVGNSDLWRLQIWGRLAKIQLWLEWR